MKRFQESGPISLHYSELKVKAGAYPTDLFRHCKHFTVIFGRIALCVLSVNYCANAAGTPNGKQSIASQNSVIPSNAQGTTPKPLPKTIGNPIRVLTEEEQGPLVTLCNCPDDAKLDGITYFDDQGRTHLIPRDLNLQSKDAKPLPKTIGGLMRVIAPDEGILVTPCDCPEDAKLDGIIAQDSRGQFRLYQFGTTRTGHSGFDKGISPTQSPLPGTKRADSASEKAVATIAAIHNPKGSSGNEVQASVDHSLGNSPQGESSKLEMITRNPEKSELLILASDSKPDYAKSVPNNTFNGINSNGHAMDLPSSSWKITRAEKIAFLLALLPVGGNLGGVVITGFFALIVVLLKNNKSDR